MPNCAHHCDLFDTATGAERVAQAQQEAETL
jgi:hypothetical protein